ncbi:hypothetical protein H113_03055 [Trichophyton rubrum MR1459]|nr:hypothetical protein H113_03055 [Trichophyton rubrum MR1459]
MEYTRRKRCKTVQQLNPENQRLKKKKKKLNTQPSGIIEALSPNNGRDCRVYYTMMPTTMPTVKMTAKAVLKRAAGAELPVGFGAPVPVAEVGEDDPLGEPVSLGRLVWVAVSFTFLLLHQASW